MPRPRVEALTLLLPLALVCLSGRARAACTMDNDCQGDLICQDGSCVAPAASAPAVPPPAASAPAVPPPAASAAVGPPIAPLGPPPAQPAEPALVRRSLPMMVGGAIMIPVGALVLAVAVLTSGPSDCKEDERGLITPEELDRCDNKTRTYALGISGGLLVGGGIPLVVIGSQRVPAARAGVAPWLSPGVAGLKLRLEL